MEITFISAIIFVACLAFLCGMIVENRIWRRAFREKRKRRRNTIYEADIGQYTYSFKVKEKILEHYFLNGVDKGFRDIVKLEEIVEE